ncbi:hypothetical protein P3T76_014492 [Phytophthora citrophthora]|uniref:Uncharacterized protein n=1 Tax=Phytophthora citrophthora TaxID=4793 RepID=A0AAD9G1L9_9STRA|nr:hypothetical protein P3T76_014492 [Phytophthora citrophthora]
MTGLKAMGPADHLAVPGLVKTTTLSDLQSAQRAHVERLQIALAEMHENTGKANATARAAGRKAHNKKTSVAMTQLRLEISSSTRTFGSTHAVNFA